MGVKDCNENNKKIVQLGKNFDLKSILDNVECYEDNPRYDSYKASLETLLETSLKHINPMGYVIKGEAARYLPGSSLYSIYCVVTLGPWIDQQIKKCFADYDYLEGMMLNVLGDHILYEATNELYSYIKDEVEASGNFLTIRYEPGNSVTPIEVQKEICDIIKTNFTLDLSVTEGYMISPTKSLAYFYGVESEDCSLGIDHDCSACQSVTCIHRKYIIKVHMNGELKLIQAKKGENLLEALRRHSILIESPCSGKRLCGKCKVHVPEHGYDVDIQEAKFLSEDEKNKDILLACFHEVNRNLEIKLEDKVNNYEIMVDYTPIIIKSFKYNENNKSHCKLGVGIDIGTTTVAISLIDLVSHKVLGTEKVLNPQKAYGADVISRILYVAQNPDHPIGTIIRETLEKGITELMNKGGYDYNKLEEIVVSGNTTMIYLLLDINPEKLAVSPFTTVDMGLFKCKSEKLWNLPVSCQVTILPWISAYVGGDIVSGLYASHLLKKKENILFIDIGTNGEMVLKNDNRLISAATAAGPAFEGANIRCGMGSVNGAICEIIPKDSDYNIKVLGDVEPKGICGSALIDAIAILLKRDHIENTGYMEKPYMFHNEIGIHPADVRQVQLAKAAIAAGITVLLNEANLTYDDIDYVYIAGGFGSHLNIKNATAIGLIPIEVENKVVVVGNASLAGSIRYLLEKEGNIEIEEIVNQCAYLELSTSRKFNEAYVDHMMFGGL